MNTQQLALVSPGSRVQKVGMLAELGESVSSIKTSFGEASECPG